MAQSAYTCWIESEGETENDGVTVNAYDDSIAASDRVEQGETDSAEHYKDAVVVAVKDATGKITRFSVTGDWSRVYFVDEIEEPAK